MKFNLINKNLIYLINYSVQYAMDQKNQDLAKKPSNAANQLTPKNFYTEIKTFEQNQSKFIDIILQFLQTANATNHLEINDNLNDNTTNSSFQMENEIESASSKTNFQNDQSEMIQELTIDTSDWVEKERKTILENLKKYIFMFKSIPERDAKKNSILKIIKEINLHILNKPDVEIINQLYIDLKNCFSDYLSFLNCYKVSNLYNNI